MSDYKLYTVERDGKTVKLKSSQLTVQILSKIFGLFPESILLLSNDGYVETADPDGRFHDVDDLSHRTVSGDSLKPPAGGGFCRLSRSIWLESVFVPGETTHCSQTRSRKGSVDATVYDNATRSTSKAAGSPDAGGRIGE